MQIHSRDSGKHGWRELFISFSIYRSGDENSSYLSSNRRISNGFAVKSAPLPSLTALIGLLRCWFVQSRLPRASIFF
jgi:hypothetical protein